MGTEIARPQPEGESGEGSLKKDTCSKTQLPRLSSWRFLSGRPTGSSLRTRVTLGTSSMMSSSLGEMTESVFRSRTVRDTP